MTFLYATDSRFRSSIDSSVSPAATCLMCVTMSAAPAARRRTHVHKQTNKMLRARAASRRRTFVALGLLRHLGHVHMLVARSGRHSRSRSLRAHRGRKAPRNVSARNGEGFRAVDIDGSFDARAAAASNALHAVRPRRAPTRLQTRLCATLPANPRLACKTGTGRDRRPFFTISSILGRSRRMRAHSIHGRTPSRLLPTNAHRSSLARPPQPRLRIGRDRRDLWEHAVWRIVILTSLYIGKNVQSSAPFGNEKFERVFERSNPKSASNFGGKKSVIDATGRASLSGTSSVLRRCVPFPRAPQLKPRTCFARSRCAL